MQLLGLEPGTWADWANAIATALAFTVALVLFVIGLRDRRRAAEDHLRNQARRIWIHVGGAERESKGVGQNDDVIVLWEIHNTSDEVITNCRVATGNTPSALVAAYKPEIAIALPNTRSGGRTLIGDTREYLVLFKKQPPPMWLIFTDAAGVQWLRDSTGNLDLWRRPSRKLGREEWSVE